MSVTNDELRAWAKRLRQVDDPEAQAVAAELEGREVRTKRHRSVRQGQSYCTQ